MSSDGTKAEIAVSYAALILADAKVNITADKLQVLLQAARIEDVEPIWTALFAKALEGKDIKNLLTTVTASGPVQGPGVVAKEEIKQDGKNHEGQEETGIEDDASDSGSDIGMSLFD